MNMIFGVKDRPKFGQTILFAIQQLLAIMAATLVVPVITNGATGMHAQPRRGALRRWRRHARLPALYEVPQPGVPWQLRLPSSAAWLQPSQAAFP